MSDPNSKLPESPIIEAVVDVDCDLPAGFDLASLEEGARDIFFSEYPKFRQQFLQHHKIETKPDASPITSVRHAIHSLQFLHEDEKQLVQIRSQGFSFNRLAPYTSLDDYLSEIERTWRLFVSRAAPVQVRTVRLRYINRIPLPMPENVLTLEDYLKFGPRLPDEGKLTFTGFFYQYTAAEKETGNQAVIVLTTQPVENGILPLIFDITAVNQERGEIDNWDWLSARIQVLRDLKNRIFRNTLTEQCLKLFQH